MVNYLQQTRETKNRAKKLFSAIFWGSWEPADQQAGGRLRGSLDGRRASKLRQQPGKAPPWVSAAQGCPRGGSESGAAGKSPPSALHGVCGSPEMWSS